MSFKAIALFALLGLSQAKPAPLTLRHDDVLLLRDGEAVIMKSWDYKIEEDKREVQRRKMAREAPPTAVASSSFDSKRGCEQSLEVQVLEDIYFNNWDVVMSPVVGNTGSAGASVTVTTGYSLSNSLTISESVTAGPEDIFSASLSFEVSEEWSTSQEQSINFDVPDGQYGVIVSNPYTHRISGNVLSGCTDSPTVDAFQADSYTSQSYGDLAWVRGPIVMCNSSTYPIPFCVGSGTHS